MISPGNIPSNAYQSLSSRVMRVPMRHTFSLEQKRILMKYFEQGMVGQSLMYQEKIQQCAQEAALEFDVVRNWIGNQRRKRRLEEVQRACMHNYMDSVPPGDSPEGSISKLPHMVGAMNPRQTQVLFLPHLTKQNQQHPQHAGQQPHGSPAVDGNNHNLDGAHVENQPTPTTPVPSTPTVPSSQPVVPVVQPPPHTQSTTILRSIPRSNPAQSGAAFPSVVSVPANMPETGLSGMQSPPAAPPSASQTANPRPTQSPSHATPLSVSMSGAFQDEEIACHPTPIRGFFQAPRQRVSQLTSINAHPVLPHQRMSPPHIAMYQPMKMAPQKESELRHQEIRRVVEQIQMNLDRLEQLGCESLLATVSTADRSAYVCGTPIALQYFTKVNKDLPMAEYIHKHATNDPQFADENDGRSPTDATEDNSQNTGGKSKENTRSDGMTTAIGQMGTDRTKESNELPGDDEEDMCMMDEDENIIKAGEEVYIVNKDRFVIGTGMLFPRPHDKMNFKTSASPEFVH